MDIMADLLSTEPSVAAAGLQTLDTGFCHKHCTSFTLEPQPYLTSSQDHLWSFFASFDPFYV